MVLCAFSAIRCRVLAVSELRFCDFARALFFALFMHKNRRKQASFCLKTRHFSVLKEFVLTCKQGSFACQTRLLWHLGKFVLVKKGCLLLFRASKKAKIAALFAAADLVKMC